MDWGIEITIEELNNAIRNGDVARYTEKISMKSLVVIILIRIFAA